MSRYRGPVTRLSRRLGVMLFTNGASKTKAFNKKPYKPGEHGQKRFSQVSEYNRQLQEKQKARFMYNITEKQCRRYFEMANKSTEVTGPQFMTLLELRLDNAVYKAGFALTRQQARQIVNHGLVKLNGKRATIASMVVKVGDVIEIREKSKTSKLFEELKTAKYKAPKWLNVDAKTLKCEVVSLPDQDDIEQIIDSQLIVEYYSK